MSKDWKNKVINEIVVQKNIYSLIDGIYIMNKLKDDEDTLWRDSVFASRALKPYTTTWCEQQLGEIELKDALNEMQLSEDSIIMDLGCGDGRFVHFLLEEGYTKIVALNYEIQPIIALKERLTTEEKEKVLLICGDIHEHPLKYETADFILAWGLFTSTTDFKKSMDECLRILKTDAFMFNAEPILEHALIYSLVKNDLEEFYRTLTTKTRARMWDEKESRYRVLTLNELRKNMEDPALETLWERGINILPSLLFGGVLTEKQVDDSFKNELWNAIQNSDVGWFRQMTYFSKKTS